MATSATVLTPPKVRTSVGFTRFAWALVAWSLLVVLWGAYVRASDSGAGCGGHWPLCNGEVLPLSPSFKTLVEFSHRVTSGVTLFATVALAFFAFRLFPSRHPVRRIAILAVVFVIIEALLGAGLVLLGLVEHNASPWRVVYLCLHLVNTQLLLAAIALTAWYSRDSAAEPRGERRTIVTATLPIAVAVSVTGVIVALGDTLFPNAGMSQDFSSASHFLIRLRILHPALAILAAAYFVFAAISVLRSQPRPIAARLASAAMTIAIAQLAAGAINMALLAPITIQLIHLLLADLVWLALVLLSVEASRRPA